MILAPPSVSAGYARRAVDDGASAGELDRIYLLLSVCKTVQRLCIDVPSSASPRDVLAYGVSWAPRVSRTLGVACWIGQALYYARRSLAVLRHDAVPPEFNAMQCFVLFCHAMRRDLSKLSDAMLCYAMSCQIQLRKSIVQYMLTATATLATAAAAAVAAMVLTATMATSVTVARPLIPLLTRASSSSSPRQRPPGRADRGARSVGLGGAVVVVGRGLRRRGAPNGGGAEAGGG